MSMRAVLVLLLPSFIIRARRAFPDHGGSSPSTSVPSRNWFRESVAVTLQRAQARAIHARTAPLEASSSSLSTPLSRDYLSWGSHGDCGVFLVFVGRWLFVW